MNRIVDLSRSPIKNLQEITLLIPYANQKINGRMEVYWKDRLINQTEFVDDYPHGKSITFEDTRVLLDISKYKLLKVLSIIRKAMSQDVPEILFGYLACLYWSCL